MDAQPWERRGPPVAPALPAGEHAIYPVSPAEIMELLACDRARTGLSRGPLLARLMAEHPHQSFVAVHRKSGAFSGHVFRAGDAIGPLVADTPDVAARLLRAAETAGAPPRALVLLANPHAARVFAAAGYAPAAEPRRVADARAETEYAVVEAVE